LVGKWRVAATMVHPAPGAGEPGSSAGSKSTNMSRREQNHASARCGRRFIAWFTALVFQRLAIACSAELAHIEDAGEASVSRASGPCAAYETRNRNCRHPRLPVRRKSRRRLLNCCHRLILLDRNPHRNCFACTSLTSEPQSSCRCFSSIASTPATNPSVCAMPACQGESQLICGA